LLGIASVILPHSYPIVDLPTAIRDCDHPRMKIKACRFRAKTGEPERGAGSRTAIPAIRRASCRARNHETCHVWPGAARWFVLLMNASERCFLIHTRQRRGLFLRRPHRTSQTRPTRELLWTSKIRILNGGFWRTNRSYRFSLRIWQKRNQDFWTGYSKYSRNTTHWAIMSRTTLTQPHTQSSLSIK
jgi:hypothetical protein